MRTGKGRELSADVRRVIDGIPQRKACCWQNGKNQRRKDRRLNLHPGHYMVIAIALAGFFIQKLRSDFAERKTAIRRTHE